METAKVDIRKLQMLNDRIAQTIEALNQVRLSVHGIQHTTGTINPLINSFAGQTGYNPVYGSAFGVNQGFNTPFTPGFGHTTGSLGWNPYAAQVLAQQALAAQQQAAIAAQNPVNQFWGTNVNPFFGSQGLGHTTASVLNPLVNDFADRGGFDPYWTSRVSQTFPFIQWGYSPFAAQMF